MLDSHYRTLRLKMVTMTLCFSLIPLFVLGGTIYYQFTVSHSDQVTQALRTLVQNRQGALELFFEERIAQLTTIANTQPLDRLTDEQFLDKIFNIMQSRSRHFIDMGVIDQEGNHLAYVGPFHDKLMAVNYAHEDWFSATLSSGMYISDVFLGFRKIPHFIIAVTRVEGNRSWILRATINSEVIESIVRAGQVGKAGDAFIVNRANILQTAPRFSGKLLERPEAPDFSAATGTQVEQVDFRGTDALFATTRLANPKWVLVVRQDPREEMAPLFKARYVEGLILAGGVLLVVLSTIFTSGAMTKALSRVEKDKAESDNLVLQSAKMASLGKLAAGVAHEINNPLQIIGEKTGWMKDLLDEEDVSQSRNFREYEDCILKIERQLERCRNVTHRLLRFGRRMEPTQESVDINHVLGETITFLANEAHFREIEIATHFDEQLPKISTDMTQLQQVFLNIVENAIDAIGKLGRIDITTSFNPGPPREVTVEIADTGPGIPRDILNKIFDPFFTTKNPAEGTGLGLSISHTTIGKLGGRILVASEEGIGTTFKIYLPA